MDLQDATIIYLALILPIILILSFTLSVSIKEIRVANDYQHELIDATRDGIKAFEINTSNEKFRDVSDALKIMVQASINTFREGFAKRIGIGGASKSSIDAYIPLTLFTLNDGYYIDSPSFTPHVLKFQRDGVAANVGDYGVSSMDGKNYKINNNEYNLATVGDPANPTATAKPHEINVKHNSVIFQTRENDAQDPKNMDQVTGTIDPTASDVIYDRSNLLKNYIPYSARYDNGTTNAIISYSMDNYISVIGKKGAPGSQNTEYFSRSGYLLDPNIEIKVEGIAGLDTLSTSISDKTIDKLVDSSSNEIKLTINGVRRTYISPENGEEKEEILNDVVITYHNLTGNYLDPLLSNNAYLLQKRDAIKYYIKSYYFTKWVYNTLGDLKIGDIKENLPESLKVALEKSGKFSALKEINEDTKKQLLFTKTDKNGYQITNDSSVYNDHKQTVMRNSIQYNIYIAAANYSKVMQNSLDKNPNFKSELNIPLIKESDWEMICKNISMVSFVHGLKTPRATYSSYAIVSSGDNQFTVNEKGLYFVRSDKFNKGLDPDLKPESYVDYSPLGKSGEYKYHKITSTELKDDQLNENQGYVGDLINNFVYDGRELTAAEKRRLGSNSSSGGGVSKLSETEYLRKNFKSYKSVVEDDAYMDTDVILNDSPARKSSLLAAIGAIKNNRFNLISIKENRSYKIIKSSGDAPLNSSTSYTIPSSVLASSSSGGGYVPSIKSIQIVIKLPSIDEVARGAFDTIVNPRVNYTLKGVWNGQNESFENSTNYQLSPAGSNALADGLDIKYETKEIFNLPNEISPREDLKPTKYIDLNTNSFGTGECRIEFENIRTNSKNESNIKNLDIVEIRVNYN